LYPEYKDNIIKFANSVCNDSFYTFVNLLYSSQAVAVACILFAAMRFNQPTPNEPHTFNYDSLFDHSYLRRKQPKPLDGSDKDKLRQEFDSLSWEKKLDDNLELVEVVESLG
jgi:hypothetical protein